MLTVRRVYLPALPILVRTTQRALRFPMDSHALAKQGLWVPLAIFTVRPIVLHVTNTTALASSAATTSTCRMALVWPRA